MVVGDIERGTEVLILGGGPGGYHAAAVASRFGKEVTLVEADALGGVCLNTGCIPSKVIIQATQNTRLPYLRNPSVDFGALQQYKEQVVARLCKGVEQILKQGEVDVVRGHAQFSGANRVTVSTCSGTQSYKFQHCIIATGSVPISLPAFSIDDEQIIDSTGALALTSVPDEMVVLGGGYIGLELGTAYAKLGSRVTMIEAMERLLPGMDPELGRTVHKRLEQLGVSVHLNTRAQGWEVRGKKAAVIAEAASKQFSVTGDKVLVAVGRRPNSADLDLKTAGVAVDARGYILTDMACRTSVSNIFAIGDVTVGPMLAHKATKEAEVAAAVIAGRPASMDAAAIPLVVFSDPEIASVGLTEAEAREKGWATVSGRSSFAISGRALALGEPEGFVKVVADADSGLILGVQMAGPEVTELIAQATLAIELGARAEDLAETVFPHPTLSETIMAAAQAIRLG